MTRSTHSAMQAYGRFIHRNRWLVVIVWIVFILVSIPFALRTPSVLQGGGYFNFPSQSLTVQDRLSRDFGQPPSSAAVVFAGQSDFATDARYQSEVRRFRQLMRQQSYVSSVSTPEPGKSLHSVLVTVGFKYNDDVMQNKIPSFRRLLPKVSANNSAAAYTIGNPVVFESITNQSFRDVEQADAIALPVTAAFGVWSVVFQNGWFGFQRVNYICVLLPGLLFTLLFGLSMDYQIFLLTRVREEWKRHWNSREAVALGVGKTGGVITSAALLFVTVSASFMTGTLESIQELGLGITFAILIDATIIRLLLVPAAMYLLGNASWWGATKPDNVPSIST